MKKFENPFVVHTLLATGIAAVVLTGCSSQSPEEIEQSRIDRRSSMSATQRFVYDYSSEQRDGCLFGTPYTYQAYNGDSSIVEPGEDGIIRVLPNIPNSRALVFRNVGGEVPLQPADEFTELQLIDASHPRCNWVSYED